MALSAGQLLAQYRIGGKIGAGGMGEVWEATDTSLGRGVAIKVLPDAVARDPERLARFEREARLLASLSHTGIAAVYGLHEADGVRFLAMELVPGEDLAERLTRGPLSTEVALRIALQVAEAVEAAHEQGIIHRDLKPANVRIMPDGRVKVLDFGLAKALETTGPAGSGELSHSPTLTTAHTVAGVILGTAGYMSPEQAAGQHADKRADIWSFGVMLHEMLTGARLFQGETISHTLADVLRASIDWDKLPASVPSSVRRLLQRCLDRDPKRRLRDIGEARIRIEEILAGGADAGATAVGARRGWASWIVAAVAVLVAAISIVLQLGGSEPAPRRVGRFGLKIPNSGSLRQGDGRAIVLSPDGRWVVSRGSTGIDDLLYLRALESFEIRPLAGTNGAQQPVFSPDGRWLAYTGSRGLYKINLAGGAPTLLGSLPASTLGLTWSRDGFLYYSASGNIWRIPEKGGEGVPVTSQESGQGKALRNPHALPSGKTLLLDQSTSASGAMSGRLMALDPSTGQTRELGLEGSCPIYVGTGHLLYVRGDQAMAVRFDADTLEPTGTPIPILDRVWIESSIMQLDVSTEGTLVYLPRRPGEQHRLVLVDRKGLVRPLIDADLPFRVISDPRFSPDAKRVVVTSGNSLWVVDLESATPTLVSESGFYPVWGNDGGTIVYSSMRGESFDLYRRSIDLSEPEALLLDRKNNLRSQALTRDGTLVVREEIPGKGMDLWIWPAMTDEPSIRPLLSDPEDELAAAVSPDGRWLAYVSDQSGRDEIYVTGFPQAGGRVQVSASGATSPAWSPRGDELYYMEGDGLVAVHVATQPSFRVVRREPLFRGSYLQYRWHRQYDVHPDGEQFLMIQSPPAGDVEIVLNWFTELERLTAEAQ